MRSSRNSLLAAMAIAMMGAGQEAGPAMTLRSAGSGNNRRPHKPKRDTAQAAEIADWNDAVEARKAAKRDRRAAPDAQKGAA